MSDVAQILEAIEHGDARAAAFNHHFPRAA
jgi:hypothetical protein